MANWQELIDQCEQRIDSLNDDISICTEKKVKREELREKYIALNREFVNCYDGNADEGVIGKKATTIAMRDSECNLTSVYYSAEQLRDYISGEDNSTVKTYISDAIDYLSSEISKLQDTIDQDYGDISSQESDISYYEDRIAEEEADDDDDDEDDKVDNEDMSN